MVKVSFFWFYIHMAKFDGVPPFVEIDGSCVKNLIDGLSIPDNPIFKGRVHLVEKLLPLFNLPWILQLDAEVFDSLCPHLISKSFLSLFFANALQNSVNSVLTSSDSRTSIRKAVSLLMTIPPLYLFGLLLYIAQFIASYSLISSCLGFVFLKGCIDSGSYKEVLYSFWVEPIFLVFGRLLYNFAFPEMRQC